MIRKLNIFMICLALLLTITACKENENNIVSDTIQSSIVTEEITVTLPNGEDISGIDINKNGRITIDEAEQAGFKMPISSDHWLYKYMCDGDGDGQVGEHNKNKPNE